MPKRNTFMLNGGLYITNDEPIDSRILVSSYDELISASTWSGIPIYNGLIVGLSDGSGDIYTLKDKNNPTSTSSWKKVTESVAFSGTTIPVGKTIALSGQTYIPAASSVTDGVQFVVEKMIENEVITAGALSDLNQRTKNIDTIEEDITTLSSITSGLTSGLTSLGLRVSSIDSMLKFPDGLYAQIVSKHETDISTLSANSITVDRKLITATADTGTGVVTGITLNPIDESSITGRTLTLNKSTDVKVNSATTSNSATTAHSAITAESAQTVPASVVTAAETQLSTGETQSQGNVISNIYVDGHKITVDKGVSVYTKSEIDSKISSVYKVKGSVTSYADLVAISAKTTGDVYNVVQASGTTPAGTNYVWNGSVWDPLGGTVDLSSYSQLSSVTYNGEGVVTGVTLDENGVRLTVHRVTGLTGVTVENAHFSEYANTATAATYAESATAATSATTAESAVTAESATTAESADTLSGFETKIDNNNTLTTTQGYVVGMIGKDSTTNKIYYKTIDKINSATTANSAQTVPSNVIKAVKVNSASTADSADALKNFDVENDTGDTLSTTKGSVVGVVGKSGNKVIYKYVDKINSAVTAESAQTVPASVIKVVKVDSASTADSVPASVIKAVKVNSASTADNASTAATLSGFDVDSDTGDTLSTTKGSVVGVVGKNGNKVIYKFVDSINSAITANSAQTVPASVIKVVKVDSATTADSVPASVIKAVKVNSATTADTAATLSGFVVEESKTETLTTSLGGVIGSMGKSSSNNKVVYKLVDKINSATTADSAAALSGFAVNSNSAVSITTGQVVGGMDKSDNVVRYKLVDKINSATTANSAQTVPASVIKVVKVNSATTANSADTVPSGVVRSAETKLSTEAPASSNIGNVITDISVDNHTISIQKEISVYTTSEIDTQITKCSVLSSITTTGSGVVTGASWANDRVTLQLNRTTAVKVNSASTADNALTATTLNGYAVEPAGSETISTSDGGVIAAIGKSATSNKVIYIVTDKVNSAKTANSATTATSANSAASAITATSATTAASATTASSATTANSATTATNALKIAGFNIVVTGGTPSSPQTNTLYFIY